MVASDIVECLPDSRGCDNLLQACQAIQAGDGVVHRPEARGETIISEGAS
jgi:hypothetical protein